jgi:hypothetical protein
MLPRNDRCFVGTPNTDANGASDINDVRERFWDYLFKTKAIHTLDDVAALVGCDVATVSTAVKHVWFRVADDRVSIAYVTEEICSAPLSQP